MVDLRDALREAMKTRSYTYDRLLKESGLKCDVTSLNRKLNGSQGLEAHEGKALAKVLGVKVAGIDRAVQLARPIGATVSWVPTKRRGAA